mmetsp:Transcript_60073/g.112213  ORF Transcript_60073/g.112213 Transcript_60073/m.112213 type:complete len:156 (+) Transcript_60073:71-538(+)
MALFWSLVASSLLLGSSFRSEENMPRLVQRVADLLCNSGMGYDFEFEGLDEKPHKQHPCCEEMKACAGINPEGACKEHCHVTFRPPPELTPMDMYLPSSCAAPAEVVRPSMRRPGKKMNVFDVELGVPNAKVMEFKGKRLDMSESEKGGALVVTC